MALLHSLESDVASLQSNIREKYSDNPAVLKELLQNADDAGANRFAMGSSEGLPDADNPLLRGPLLFAVNDAPFGPKDAVGIHQASGGSKAADEAKIGRFGLGLKSIYRLSEVLFYLSDRPADDKGFTDPRCPPRGVINPWDYGPEDIREAENRLEAERRRPWSAFSPDDQQRVIDLLQPVLGAASHWFAIVLPLRTDRHVPEKYSFHEWRIDKDSTIANDLTGPSAMSLLAGCLPLLESVEQLHFWHEQSGRLVSDRMINLEDGARRLRRGDHKPSPAPEAIKGEISRAIDGTLARDPFNGRSIHCDGSILDGFDLESAKSQKLRTEARNGAVVISEWPSSEVDAAGVYLRWAVYLPLSHKPIHLGTAGSTRRITITFHGTFYCDSGRQRIQFSPDSIGSTESVPLTTDWNDRILRAGCLPNVIPALDDYLARYRGEERRERAREVVTALADRLQAEVGSAVEVVTQAGGYAEVPDRGNTASYRPIDLDCTMLLLPPWRERLRIRKLLPFLFDEQTDEPATVDGVKVAWVFDGPRLLPPEANPRENWTPERTRWLLSRCEPEVLLGEPGGIAFLVEILDKVGHATRFDTTVQTALMGLVRQLLSVADQKHLRVTNNKVPVKGLVGLLQDSRRISMPRDTPVGVYEGLTDALNARGGDVVFVPQDLTPETAAGRLDQASARELLAVVAAHTCQQPDDDLLEVPQAKFAMTQAIVTATFPDVLERSALRSLLACLALLPLRFGRGKADTLSTVETLFEMGEQHRVFCLFNQPGLKVEFLEASLKVPIAVLHSSDTALAEWFKCLLARGVPNFEAATIVECLARNAEHLVDAVGPREQLFKALVKENAVNEPEGPAVLRRLLAGAGVGEDFDLFQAGKDEPAKGLLLAMNAPEQGRSIMEVDSSLLDDLPPSVVTKLGVDTMDVASVARWWRKRRNTHRRLDPASAERVRSAFAADPQAARSVVTSWPKDDFPELKGLPLFEASDGRMVDLADDPHPTEGGMEVGEVELPGLTLLRLPPDEPKYAERLEQLDCKPLGPDVALQHGLKIVDPRQREQFMLRCLEVRKDDKKSPVAPAVRKGLWLLTRTGEGVAPDSVICLKQEAGDQLHPDIRSLFCLPQDLACFNEKGSLPEVLLQVIPTSEKSFPRLGRELGDLGHGMGPGVNAGADDDELDEQLEFWLGIFENAAEAQPAAPLLRSLSKTHRRLLVRKLVKAVPDAERFAPMIEAIREAYDDPDHKKDRPRLVELLREVLAQAISDDRWEREQLPKVHLLNRAGAWVPAGKLTLPRHNVSPSACLRDELASVWRDQMPSAAAGVGDVGANVSTPSGRQRSASDEPARAEGRRKLEAFCNRWIDAGLPEKLAWLPFALLGDNDDFAKVYRNRVGQKELESIRRQAFEGWTHRTIGSSEEAMASCHFLIEEAVVGKVEVRSLDGQVRWVDSTKAPDVFLETPPHLGFEKLDGGGHGYRLTLRAVDPPADVGQVEKEGRKLWKATLENIIKGCYGGVPDFGQTVDRASKPEQYDLRHARLQLQEQLEARLEQPLKLRNRGTLRLQFEKLKALKLELTKAKVDEDSVLMKESLHTIEQLQNEIVTLIEDDAEVQDQLLVAIREKLKELSYDASSIPFELFQNADDAAGEAVELFGESEAKDVRLFHFDASDEQLLVVHHGRPINHCGHRSRDLKDRYFDNDLANMLALNASDKRSENESQESPEKQTGHFGLGFKSVLCFSDRPQLFSGRRLGLEIRGGVLPVALDDDDKARLKRQGEAAGAPPSWGPTVLRLPRRARGPEVDRVVKAFETAAPLTVCFARHLRHINLHRTGRQNRVFTGEPEANMEAGAVRLEVHRWESEDRAAPRALLVARDTQDGYRAVAVIVGQEGVVRNGLGDLPRVWATCPTAETEKPWFAINADFELNPGRTQLHERGQNEHLITALRPLLRAVLDAIQRAVIADEPDEVCRAFDALGFRPQAALMVEALPGLIPAGLGENPPPVRKFLNELQVGDSGALSGYFRDGAPFATGLGEGWPASVIVSETGFVCDGLLRRPEVRQAADKLVQLLSDPAHPVRHLVSPTRREDLGRLGLGLDLKPYDLNMLIASVLQMSDRKLTPGLAGLLEPIFKLDRLQEVSDSDAEIQALRHELDQAEFTSAEGSHTVTAGQMIVPWHDEESALVAGVFGPARTVAADYEQAAPGLMHWLSWGENWTLQDLVIAFREAEDTPRRAACLWYAVRGRDRCELCNALEDSSGWWTSLKSTDAAARKLEDNDRYDLARRLKIEGFQAPQELGTQHNFTPAPSGPSYEQRCAALAEYCENRGPDFEKVYDRWVYPDHRPRVAEIDDDDLASDLAVRREWMLLLIRGSLFSMGRTTEDQHRRFLDEKMTDGRSWLDVFATPHSDENFEPWAELIKDTIQRRNEFKDNFAYWLSNILNIFQINIVLPAYVRVLKSLPQQMTDNPEGNPHWLVDVRNNPAFSGSTLDAPTLLRPLGRIGFGFVLRELFRLGVYDPADESELRKHAFTNKKAIRELVGELTGHTPDEEEGGIAIYDELCRRLEDPFFGGLPDLPLHLLASHKDYKSARAEILVGRLPASPMKEHPDDP